MSALGLTQTVLATQLIEAVRKDAEAGKRPFNLTANRGNGKIDDGATADWIRSVAAQLQSLPNIKVRDNTGLELPAFRSVDGVSHVRACVDLKVPETGVDWLDDLITKSRLDDFKKAALTGVCAACDPLSNNRHDYINKRAREIALLAAAPTGITED
jgi:hypothetical protein